MHCFEDIFDMVKSENAITSRISFIQNRSNSVKRIVLTFEITSNYETLIYLNLYQSGNIEHK